MNELTPDEHRILVDAIHDSATVIHKGQRMNEKIKELAEQYACHAETMTGVETEYIFDDEDLQDFVELIVQECAEVLSDNRFNNVRPTMNIAQAMIRQHFGVEE